MKNSDTNFLPAIYWILCKRLKKRCWLLFLGILCIVPARGQLKSELNLPRAGDVIIKQQVEYKDPGRAGENVLWDFGKLPPVNPEYKLKYATPHLWKDSLYILGADTFRRKDAENTQLIVGHEHQTKYFYQLKDNILYCLGYENHTSRMHYTDPLPVMHYPTAYGLTAENEYRSECLYSSLIEMFMHGHFRQKADACGMMILPSGDTLKNVLRIRSEQTILSDAVPSMDSIHIDTQIETYKWFAQGYRYPVFETVKAIHRQNSVEDVFTTAFFYPPQEHYYLETDPENRAIVETQGKGNKENPLEGSTFNAYPNPVGSTLEVEVFIPTDAKIKIQVRSVVNKSVYINENEGKFAPGSHHFQFNVSKLPAGYYLVNIWADNYLLSETVLKQ